MAGKLGQVSAERQAQSTSPTLTTEQLTSLADAFAADVAAGRHKANGWGNSNCSWPASPAGLFQLARLIRHRRDIPHRATPAQMGSASCASSPTRSCSRGDTPPTPRSTSTAAARDTVGLTWRRIAALDRRRSARGTRSCSRTRHARSTWSSSRTRLYLSGNKLSQT